MQEVDLKEQGIFNYNKSDDFENNPHYFMCEELLVPRCNCSDSQRINMFSSHISQLVHLKDPDIPKVFTRFENQIGKYSVGYKKADDDFEIIERVDKNKFCYDLIVQYKTTKLFDIIHMKNYCNISESYGYRLNDKLQEKAVKGNTIKKDDLLYASDSYDDELNLKYGKNLRAVFLAFHNTTYEDGIVISKSAAEKMKSFKVEKTTFSINSNDILLNLYGDSENFKSFPRVGDDIKDRILCALRRIDFSKMMYDFQTERLKEIDPLADDIIYSDGGTVVDLDVFSNIPLEQYKKRTDEFSKEISEVLENQQNYYKKMAAALEKIIPLRMLSEVESRDRSCGKFVPMAAICRAENKNSYTDEVGYMWKVSHECIEEEIKWKFDGKSFDNIKVTFTILKENPLVEGCKIS